MRWSKIQAFFRISSWKSHKLNFFLAVVPLLLSLILFFKLFLPSWQRWQETKALLAQRRALLLKYQEKLKELSPPPVPEKGEDPYRYLFRGRDPYIIISEIQKLLEDIEGLNIRSFRVLNQKPFQAGIKKVEVQFQMEGDIKALAEALERLDRYEKALLIKNLIVSRLVRRKKESLQIYLRLEALFQESP